MDCRVNAIIVNVYTVQESLGKFWLSPAYTTNIGYMKSHFDCVSMHCTMLLLMLLLLQKLRFLCVFFPSTSLCARFSLCFSPHMCFFPQRCQCIVGVIYLVMWYLLLGFDFYVIDRHRTETIFYFILNEIPFFCHRICVFRERLNKVFFIRLLNSTLL